MDGVSVALCLVLFALALYQVLLSAVFVIRTRAGRLAQVETEDLPKAAILLALRGADPDLRRGLIMLMQQDYPHYELHIVVDSMEDPAWPLVQDAVGETGANNVKVTELRERTKSQSLHCASLVQLANDLDDSFEVFVLADGDLTAHRTWLRELITPIAEGSAAATSGNRWYMPREGQLGSIVRYLWNTAAVVSMYFLRIPWGGTFAARTSDLRRSGLIDKWRRALAVDAPICEAWREIGLRVQFVPSLMMPNREECGLASSLVFFQRQLTWTRLYQPAVLWRSVFAHAFVTTGVMAFAAAVAIYGLAVGQVTASVWAIGGIAGYMLGMIVATGLLEYRVRRIIRSRGEAVDWLSFWSFVKLVLAVPITQCIHQTAVVLAQIQKRLLWRGVTYTIRAPFDVEMVDERPTDEWATPAGSRSSL